MGRGNVTGQELADLVERTAEAASAFIRGDIRRYLTLIRHADDYTLMAPSGGEPRRGFDASDQAVEALAGYFRGSELPTMMATVSPRVRGADDRGRCDQLIGDGALASLCDIS